MDISELNIGDSVMVSDLKASRNYEITEDDNTTIVSVTPPEEMPEEEPEPLEVDADPEASEEKFEDEKAGTDEAKQ